MTDETVDIAPKRIGILTSGGDCPGLNAVIYAVVKYARIAKSWRVYGIPNGTDGFVDIANGICQNDIPMTDRVVGFDTAVDTVAATLHNLSFTAASHDHVMIVEVMGRDGGHLALHAGIAGGADVILIPELIPFLTEKVVANICDRIAQIYRQRRKFALIVIAEGIDSALPTLRDRDPLAEPVSKSAIGADLKQYVDCHSQQSDFCGLLEDLEVRVSVLGRIQRSSPPTTLDRLLAVSFGVKAVDAIAQSQSPSQQIVVWKGGQTQIEPLARVIEKIRAEKAARQAAKLPACAAPVDPQGFMLHTARSLGIYVGD